MLVTENFVFLHVPKTGGSFIKTVLSKHLPVIDHKAAIGREVWSHEPHASLPASLRRLPIVWVVRNPWDWYVSWFHFHAVRGPRRRPGADPWGKRAVWEGALRSGNASFAEAIAHFCHGSFDHPLAPTMRREGLDFYSAQIQDIVGEAFDRPDVTVIRFERLREELLSFVRSRMEVTSEFEAAIRREPPRRQTEHEPYPVYYDADLAELVGEKTRWLCRRFQYSFDGEGGSSPSVVTDVAQPSPGRSA